MRRLDQDSPATAQAGSALLLATAVSSLTARQQYFVAVVGCSDSLGEAARSIGVHTNALSAKLRAIAHRLGLADTSDLVALARRKQILDAAADPICGVDPAGVCVFANSAAANLLGYHREDLVGSDIHALIHSRRLDGSERPLADCVLHQVAAGIRGKHEGETVLWAAGGKPRWVTYSAVAVGENDEAGDHRVVVVTLRDLTAQVHAEWKRSLTETQLEMALEATGIAAFQVDLRSERIVGWGNRLSLSEGMPYDQFVAAVHPDDRHKVSLDSARALPMGSVAEDDIVLCAPTGEERIMHSRIKVIPDSSGEPAMLLGAAIDITATRDAERMHQAFLDASVDAFVRTDAFGWVMEWNRAAETLFGYPKERALGRQIEDLIIPARYRDECRGIIEKITSSAGRAARIYGPLEVDATRSDGEEVPVEATFTAIALAGGVVVQGMLRDISARKAAEAQLLQHAVTDQLTGLANRALLQDRLAQALFQLRRSAGTLAVLFIDIDRFKVVNETIGHAAGDQIIREVARRITAVTRPGDTAARFGSDQFVLACEGTDEHQALKMSDVVLEAMADTIAVGGYRLTVTASIGIAVTDDPQADPGHLLRDADAAMFRAKENGGAHAEIFDSTMRKNALARLELEADLRRALANDELRVFYQPVVDVTTEAITGVEALVRWQHPERGLLAPDTFLPVAESSGLIIPLGLWVLQAACANLSSWTGCEHLHLAVNLSARQLVQPDLVATIAGVLDTTGLAPERVCLELTESALTDDTAAAVTTIERLDRLGVTLAVDDFGTGYSSLLRLRRFPISLLKLDKQFISGLGRNQDDTAIVKASLELAHSLGITAVAEGVERSDQLTTLRSLGCELAQGHLWSPAIPAEQVQQLLIAPRDAA